MIGASGPLSTAHHQKSDRAKPCDAWPEKGWQKPESVGGATGASYACGTVVGRPFGERPARMTAGAPPTRWRYAFRKTREAWARSSPACSRAAIRAGVMSPSGGAILSHRYVGAGSSASTNGSAGA